MKSILIGVLLAFTNAKDESVDDKLKDAAALTRVASDKSPLPEVKAPAADLPEAEPKAAPAAEPESKDKIHFFIFDNKKMLWNNDFELYRKEHGGDGDENNCRLAESDNWLGA